MLFQLVYLFLNWRKSALKYFVVFCQTSTWISHRYTYIPFPLNLPPSPSPSHPARLIQSLCLSFLSQREFVELHFMLSASLVNPFTDSDCHQRAICAGWKCLPLYSFSLVLYQVHEMCFPVIWYIYCWFFFFFSLNYWSQNHEVFYHLKYTLIIVLWDMF